MNFYGRYIKGEDGRTVCKDIYNLGQNAFNEEYFTDVKNVLTETFKRVDHNLNVIYSELKQIGYEFNSDIPLSKPNPKIADLLTKLDNSVEDFGHVPYSLRLFFEIVGACDFAWNYERFPEMFWQCADPIQISCLNDLVVEVSTDDWKDYMTEIVEVGLEYPHLELAADYLHKDNISGGPAYAIQLTKEKSIDSLFLNESNEITFIDYLRICMENCGFSKITKAEYDNDYQSFFNKVKPQLMLI